MFITTTATRTLSALSNSHWNINRRWVGQTASQDSGSCCFSSLAVDGSGPASSCVSAALAWEFSVALAWSWDIWTQAAPSSDAGGNTPSERRTSAKGMCTKWVWSHFFVRTWTTWLKYMFFLLPFLLFSPCTFYLSSIYLVSTEKYHQVK